MLITKHTVETIATLAQVWQVLQDVENWKTWDHEIESISINGPFMADTTGTLKIKGGPVLKTRLTKVVPLKMFVQEARLTLATVVMTHSISQLGTQTQVTFQTEIHGPLAFLFAWLLGNSIKKKIPIEMQEMLKQAVAIPV